MLEPEARKTLQSKTNIALEAKMLQHEQKMASGVKMLLQKQIYLAAGDKKVATGANMWLKKPIHDYRSQDVTAGAMMWLQKPLHLDFFVARTHILFF